MSHAEDHSKKREAWKLLSEAGLVDIRLDEFPERIKEAKHIVSKRLNELLQRSSNAGECQSTAYSLGTLRRLETTLAEAPPSTSRMRPEEPEK